MLKKRTSLWHKSQTFRLKTTTQDEFTNLPQSRIIWISKFHQKQFTSKKITFSIPISVNNSG
jgi:hypothetical protein